MDKPVVRSLCWGGGRCPRRSHHAESPAYTQKGDVFLLCLCLPTTTPDLPAPLCEPDSWHLPARLAPPWVRAPAPHTPVASLHAPHARAAHRTRLPLGAPLRGRGCLPPVPAPLRHTPLSNPSAASPAAATLQFGRRAVRGLSAISRPRLGAKFHTLAVGHVGTVRLLGASLRCPVVLAGVGPRGSATGIPRIQISQQDRVGRQGKGDDPQGDKRERG